MFIVELFLIAQQGTTQVQEEWINTLQQVHLMMNNYTATTQPGMSQASSVRKTSLYRNEGISQTEYEKGKSVTQI